MESNNDQNQNNVPTGTKDVNTTLPTSNNDRQGIQQNQDIPGNENVPSWALGGCV